MMVSYFIYYRIAPGQEALARERATRLQTRLAEAAGVRSRLLTKCGEPNLWMEIYEAVVDAAAFERALDTAVGELRICEGLADGSRRHMECFEDWAVCA